LILGLDVIGRFDLERYLLSVVSDDSTNLQVESDGFASENIHKELHATAEMQGKVKGCFLLDVAI
jgi:hypothetical protein